MELTIKPIGFIETEFEEKSGIPIQSTFGKEYQGVINLFSEYSDGLKDLDQISHIYLLYHFHQHSDYNLVVRPYMDETPRGLFATRAPKRPSGIGLSIVEIIKIKENKMYVIAGAVLLILIILFIVLKIPRKIVDFFEEDIDEDIKEIKEEVKEKKKSRK